MSPFDDDRIRIFRGRTTAEALRNVRLSLGGDAVVLRTRQVSEPDAMASGGTRRLIEVAASAEPLTHEPPVRRPVRVAAVTTDEVPDVAASLTAPEHRERDPDETPADVTGTIDRRLETIERALLELLETRSRLQSQLEPSSAVPASPVAVEGNPATPSDRNEPPPDEPAVDRFAALRDRLVASPPPTASLIAARTDRVVVTAFVGESGSGKTTALAKRVADLTLRGQRVGVVSIVMDGTPDPMLARLADGYGVPLGVAEDATSLPRAFEAVAGVPHIVVDTPALDDNPARLFEMLARIPIDQLLVTLSVEQEPAKWHAACETLETMQPDAAVLTHFDRLLQPERLLETPLPIAALGYGPNVPGDLFAGESFDWSAVV